MADRFGEGIQPVIGIVGLVDGMILAAGAGGGGADDAAKEIVGEGLGCGGGGAGDEPALGAIGIGDGGGGLPADLAGGGLLPVGYGGEEAAVVVVVELGNIDALRLSAV